MWIHIPKESCPSTQEEEDSTLDLSWLFPMLEQCVTWRENFRQSEYWQKRWKEDSWMTHLFGQIPQPSIANLGLEKWIGSLGDSHVSHGQLQEAEKEKKTKDGSGMISGILLARYNQKESSWKTCQASLLDMGSTVYSDRFPNWGMMQDGEMSKLQTPELPIVEHESLSWLINQGSLWSTPVKSDTGARKNKYNQGGTPLSMQAWKSWNTPTASNPTKWSYTSKTQSGRDLEMQGRRSTSLCQTSLPAQNLKDGEKLLEKNPELLPLWKRLRLNPTFVEWLMGLPLGYTELIDLEYLETELYLYKQRMLLESLLEE